jgi:hypothetical protein
VEGDPEFDYGVRPARVLRAPVLEAERADLGGCVDRGADVGGSFQRSDLNAARISLLKSSGSSHAAKWPPLSTSLKYTTFG